MLLSVSAVAAPSYSDGMTGECIFGQSTNDLSEGGVGRFEGRFKLLRSIGRGKLITLREKNMIHDVMVESHEGSEIRDFFQADGTIEYYRDTRTAHEYVRVSYYPGDNEVGKVFYGNIVVAQIGDGSFFNCIARE
jgi:hypothetical protein